MSEKTSQRNIPVTHEDGEDCFVPKSLRHKNKNSRFAKPRDKKKAIKAATMNKLNNPSFMIIIKPHNKTYVYVPADFARNYLPNSSELITLEARNGEQRVVTSNGYPSSCSERLDKGWGRFLRENYLEEGDVCIFELINSKIIVLKVWMYRVADYASR
ncbi:B3 DNA binding domain containing protein [Parasponia andersonii]|uniref:B3 DNA binding domain containing protein n=1 Tax=Parasponia andersonii TaxID=3476 RepID=A0A2P5CH72_PARAD|nr:B3 DNA binding domain containing protein [Parasponia andersonii]